MKYVNRIRRRDGSVQLYLRKKGLPCVRLPDGLAQDALSAHVEGLIAELSLHSAVKFAPPPTTLGSAVRAYELENPDFINLAASTKYEYRLILKEFDADLGRVPISTFTAAFVFRLKGLWAQRGHRAANIRLQILKNVLKPSIIMGTLTADPFPIVGLVRRPRELEEPHLAWPESVFRIVMEEALLRKRFGLARAIAIARYTGARRGDLVRMPRSARQDGRFRFLSGKRRIFVDIPEDAHLTRWLSLTPDSPPSTPRQGRKLPKAGGEFEPSTLVYNLSGRPYTEDGLGQELAKLIELLAAEGRIRGKGYDLHGLRHTRGVELALSGCSDAEGAAMMGHGSPSSFVQYRRQADRSRLSDAADRRLAAERSKRAQSL
ncbi:hypothetical protein [Phenylobacterium sp.]|jgi:integrase|uniref:hypothetical protein n=1 Tax=Phenylobacterium sp. TaxID=1871053 RepID=UPI002F93439D